MTMATASLLAAICWAVAVAGSVSVAAWFRTRRVRIGDGDGGAVEGIRTTDLLVGGLVGAATYVALLVAGHYALRLTVFGGIAITYLVLVVGVPSATTAVLAVAWVARRRSSARATRLATRPALVLCVAGLVLAPIGIYTTHVEPALLDTDRPDPLVVASERAGDETLTIGVLTDLQTTRIGDHEWEAVRAVMAAEPDLIVLPGDFLQVDDAQFDQQLPALLDLLGGLRAPGGVYLVGGDVDKPLDRLARMVETTEVRYLADEIVTATVGDRELTIGGIGVDYDAPDARAVVDQLETRPGDDDIRILLSHRPDPVLGLRPGSRIDLQVSGHTHGGQVSVPFFGPLMTLSSVPRHVAAGGLHHLDGHAIYVGHGVGLERDAAPQIRFGVRPDIGVLTITG